MAVAAPRLAVIRKAALAAVSLSYCATSPPPAGAPNAGTPPPTSASPRNARAASIADTGVITLDAQPAAAIVIVDDVSMGSVDTLSPAGELRLLRGVHRLELRHPGYYPFRIELSVGEQPEKLRIRLQRRRSR